MENIPSKHAHRLKLADSLLQKLQENHMDLISSECERLGYTFEDLVPRPISQFKQKGTPSDTQALRFVHYEEQRLGKILKVASDIAENIEMTRSLSQLYKGLNISPINCRKSSVNSSVYIESSSIFHKPSDVIQYNIERAKQKFNRSVEIIKRIEGLKAEEKKKTENMIKKSIERQRKLNEEMNKRLEKHEKETTSVNEQRNKILKKKKEIENELNKQLLDFGGKLEKRMKKLSAINQHKLREMVNKQQEKIRKKIDDDYNKVSTDFHKERIESNEVKKMMDDLSLRIEKRIGSYEDVVKKKIYNARENNIKVERIFSKSLTDYNRRTEEKLKKIVEKSMVCDEKRHKKEEKFRKLSDDVRSSVRSSFLRTNKGIDYMNEMENKRIQKIEQRVSQKTKVFHDIKSRFEEAFKAKKQKNYNRFEGHNIKYSKALESQVINYLDKTQK